MIVQVKENQKKLLQQCRFVTQDYNPKSVHRSRDKAHGRQEQRTVRSFSIPDHQQAWFRSRGWKEVVMIVEVTRLRSVFDTRTRVWHRSREESHYVSTIPLSAQECAAGIRGHWGIENGNHHVRDVTLGEDASRIRRNPHIMAKMRSFALNVLRANGETNIGHALYRNALSLDSVLAYAHVL